MEAPEERLEAERARRGDQAAFARLMAAHQANVHQFVRSLLGLPEAEDVAQEVFLQAYRSLSSFRGDCSFGTWLYAVARNVCRHRLRWRAAARRAGKTVGDEEALALPDGEPDLLAGLEAEETRGLVRQALEELSGEHRAVLVLSHWEGLRYEEISRVLDIPVGTVKSRVHNAMAALARNLARRLELREEKR
ncbi:MAG: RNA polymerase sigma factor [Elusimicrobia bacterium]|nr:RNA polymerase sigma factor [Elusimicrobiota bacterium]MDE2237003.1 RNA polymerase sigma factor [Elusimicrobiota bacterium]MDE2424671.1 RNA polymerase sigma factor [Elusimicrobiota bacterium]